MTWCAWIFAIPKLGPFGSIFAFYLRRLARCLAATALSRVKAARVVFGQDRISSQRPSGRFYISTSRKFPQNSKSKAAFHQALLKKIQEFSAEYRGHMIRVGVIGYGYWGPNIVRNLQGLESTRVEMVCDSSSSALARVRKA